MHGYNLYFFILFAFAFVYVMFCCYIFGIIYALFTSMYNRNALIFELFCGSRAIHGTQLGKCDPCLCTVDICLIGCPSNVIWYWSNSIIHLLFLLRRSSFCHTIYSWTETAMFFFFFGSDFLFSVGFPAFIDARFSTQSLFFDLFWPFRWCFNGTFCSLLCAWL